MGGQTVSGHSYLFAAPSAIFDATCFDLSGARNVLGRAAAFLNRRKDIVNAVGGRMLRERDVFVGRRPAKEIHVGWRDHDLPLYTRWLVFLNDASDHLYQFGVTVLESDREASAVETFLGSVQLAEAMANPSLLSAQANRQQAPASPLGAPWAWCAENGSCYGDISAATGRPKTVDVGGYYRRDGTYVRGHFRSRPRW
ncbi:MAG: hypothetical protein HY744_25530 [Deltaproteobacteria bacterium]|nr:hypothetical protein [Deltaproteobacteria bacterium]